MASDHSTVERLRTGVPGLDTILRGGVFRGGIYIVQGPPGSGKTILANQLCFNEAAAGGRALYLTLLAENHSRMLAHIRGLSFFVEAAIPKSVSYFGAFQTLEETGLRGLLDSIRREVRTHAATVVILDGLVTAAEGASNLELKKFVHELQTQAIFTGCTFFLLTSGARAPQPHAPEYTMVDGLIEMKTRLFGRRAERELQVHKLRGSDHLAGEHAYRITDDGIRVFPRFEALYARPTFSDRADGHKVSTGNEVLDRLISGGPAQHSVTVVLGAAGTGKTTLGLQFLSQASAEAPGLLFGFNENPAALRIKAAALKLDFGDLLDRGHVEIIWRPTTEALVDEISHDLVAAVRRRKVQRLFIDGLDGLRKLCPDPHRLENVAAALCNELRALGVTTLLASETKQEGIHPVNALSGAKPEGLSPIAENILLLRIEAVRAESHRLLMVMKARDSDIDLRVRRFEIVEGGIAIDPDFQVAERVLREMTRQGPWLPSSPADGSPGGD